MGEGGPGLRVYTKRLAEAVRAALDLDRNIAHIP